MIAGSSHYKSARPAMFAVIVTAITFSVYIALSINFTWLLVAFGGAFTVPTLAALYFWAKWTKANQERDNIRLMLGARADDTASQINPAPDNFLAELDRTMQVCQAISCGDFEARILDITPEAPLANLQWSINELADRIDAFMREAESSMEHVAEQKYYRRILDWDMSGSFKKTADIINNCTSSFATRTAQFETIVQNFEGDIGTVSRAIFETSRTLQSSANTLSSAADSTAVQVTKVSNAADSASQNVQTVASSTEEMSASIQEISRQTQSSLSNTNTARNIAYSSNIKIQGLADAAQSIGEVIKLIEDIASQTNLLALNATIEAARAGDAGKGFAVVATEVKNLASQTARATDNISQQIAHIQTATKEAVQSMDTLNTSVEEISHAVESIATAVSEQSSASREISYSVLSASNSTQSVSQNIASVQNSATETSSTSNDLLAEANHLQEEAVDLENNVSQFLEKIRTAV